jgi:hypothetical protein
MTSESVNKLGENSYIQIGMVVVLIGAAYTLGSIRSRIDSDIASINESLTTIKSDMIVIHGMIEERTESRWSASQMQAWSHSLKDMNPTIRVPDPTNIPLKAME